MAFVVIKPSPHHRGHYSPLVGCPTLFFSSSGTVGLYPSPHPREPAPPCSPCLSLLGPPRSPLAHDAHFGRVHCTLRSGPQKQGPWSDGIPGILAGDRVRVTFLDTSPARPQRRLDKTKPCVLGSPLGGARLLGRAGGRNSLPSPGVRWGQVFPSAGGGGRSRRTWGAWAQAGPGWEHEARNRREGPSGFPRES